MSMKYIVCNLSYLSTRPLIKHIQTTPVQVKRVFSSSISIMSDEWKTRAPYKIHESDKDFHVRYEGGCHCGRVRYQLSREKPLDSKFCHCTTCQKLHGESIGSLYRTTWVVLLTVVRCAFSMGSDISQGRYQLHPRPS